MAEKTFSQKAVESVALKLIVVVAGAAGTAMLTWYTTHSAWLHSIPFYQMGPVIAVIVFLGAATIYVLIVVLGRVQRQLAEVGGCDKTWLHEHEKGDRRELHSLVRVISSQYGNAGLSLESPLEPFIVVGFGIFNASVYEVSIDPNIEGYVSFGLRPLRGKLEMTFNPYPMPRNLKHGVVSHFMLRQSLSKEDADYIKTHSDGEPHFDNLMIRVVGGDDFGFLPPTLLDFSTLL